MKIFQQNKKIDYVFHLASAASPVAYTENPVNTLKAGSLGTINTLGLLGNMVLNIFGLYI